MCEFITRNLS